MTDYAHLPGMVQFALADVQAHGHLARVEQASRMWRTVAARLRELSESLRHELEHLQPLWTDATGTDFVRQATRRKAAIDEVLTRIDEHQPWRALDDLARQLLLTRARVTDAVEQSTEANHREAAAHLAELDRYFLAAAGAVLAVAGDQAGASPTLAASNHHHAGGCCAEPGTAAPMLASDPGPGGTLSPVVAPAGSGSPLPPGSVSIPGLLAVPPGSAGGRYAPRPGAAESGVPTGTTFDPRTFAGGSLPEAGASGPHDALGGSPPDGGATDTPPRIEQAADPIPLTEQQAAASPPQPPAAPGGTSSGTTGGGGSARMFPPMMMMPMAPLAGRGAPTRGTTSARSLSGAERRTRATQATPGIPPRLRGRSALADPAGSGYRPVTMSATRNVASEPAAQEVLDHEVWQVENTDAATPLKPEVAEPEPRRLRRP